MVLCEGGRAIQGVWQCRKGWHLTEGGCTSANILTELIHRVVSGRESNARTGNRIDYRIDSYRRVVDRPSIASWLPPRTHHVLHQFI